MGVAKLKGRILADRRMARSALRLLLVPLTLLSLANGATALTWQQTWIGEGTNSGYIDLGADANDCAVLMRLTGAPDAGYDLAIRTYHPPAWEPTACERSDLNLWPMVHEDSHALAPGDGDPTIGFSKTYTIPARCSTGHYTYTIEIGPLGLETPFRYVYEAQCNAGPVSEHVWEGAVDFVLMAATPAP